MRAREGAAALEGWTRMGQRDGCRHAARDATGVMEGRLLGREVDLGNRNHSLGIAIAQPVVDHGVGCGGGNASVSNLNHYIDRPKDIVQAFLCLSDVPYTKILSAYR